MVAPAAVDSQPEQSNAVGCKKEASNEIHIAEALDDDIYSGMQYTGAFVAVPRH